MCSTYLFHVPDSNFTFGIVLLFHYFFRGVLTKERVCLFVCLFSFRHFYVLVCLYVVYYTTVVLLLLFVVCEYQSVSMFILRKYKHHRSKCVHDAFA